MRSARCIFSDGSADSARHTVCIKSSQHSSHTSPCVKRCVCQCWHEPCVQPSPPPTKILPIALTSRPPRSPRQPTSYNHVFCGNVGRSNQRAGAAQKGSAIGAIQPSPQAARGQGGKPPAGGWGKRGDGDSDAGAGIRRRAVRYSRLDTGGGYCAKSFGQRVWRWHYS